MCAPCKVLLNGNALAGKLIAMEKGLDHLRRRGYDVTPETYHKIAALICPVDAGMDQMLELIAEGPHVPFERKLIDSKKEK